MQAVDHSQHDRVSLDSYELYLKRIGSWVKDLEVVGENGSGFHLQHVQRQILEETEPENEEEEVFMLSGDRDDASLSFELDDLICEAVSDFVVRRPGRKALDLGSRPSLEIVSLTEQSVLNLEGGERIRGKEIVEKLKQLGMVGVAAAGLIALVCRH